MTDRVLNLRYLFARTIAEQASASSTAASTDDLTAAIVRLADMVSQHDLEWAALATDALAKDFANPSGVATPREHIVDRLNKLAESFRSRGRGES